jgi:site-specific recombinase XerD
MSLVSHLTDNDRFHSFKSDYQNRSLSTAITKGQITSSDADLISAFVSERKITNNIGMKRALKITSNLITVRRFIPPFKELTIPTLYRGVENILHGTSSRDREFSQNTKIDLIGILKQFCMWLVENEELTLSEKKIKAIKQPQKCPTKKASDLLTSEEIQALMAVCQTSRDRALLIMLYEGGFRVGEIGEMKWGHLIIDNSGVIVNVTLKTMIPRYVRLVMAKEHLIKWKSDYPEEITDESLVFLNERRQSMKYHAIFQQLGRLCHRAGITKHITPHIFRHTRITHLIQQGVNESVIKLMMWGSIDSKMFSNYAHLTGNDIDREIHRLYGIDPKSTQEEENVTLEPKVCPYCKEINSPVSMHCHICGHALSAKAAQGSDDFIRYLKMHASDLIAFLQKDDSEKKPQ